MESIYFYLGPQKGFWVVKLQRKQVGAIMKASHAENRLTILEIVVEIQPDQTPSMNRVKLQVSHLTHKWQWDLTWAENTASCMCKETSNLMQNLSNYNIVFFFSYLQQIFYYYSTLQQTGWMKIQTMKISLDQLNSAEQLVYFSASQ